MFCTDAENDQLTRDACQDEELLKTGPSGISKEKNMYLYSYCNYD